MSSQLLFKKPLKDKDYQKIAKLLEQNKTILYPTETIYGLGAKAFLESNQEKIRKIKSRKKSKKFIILIKDLKMLKRYAVLDKKIEKKLKPWPKKTSIILYSKQKEKIAFRISPHPFIKKLFKYITFPIISTSANISDKNPISSIEEAKKQFKNRFKKISIIVDWGKIKRRKSSKIIDLTQVPFKVLRN